jgi:hypothetical protein
MGKYQSRMDQFYNVVIATKNTYEMFLLSAPNAASICVGNNCVGQNSGFASFTY